MQHCSYQTLRSVLHTDALYFHFYIVLKLWTVNLSFLIDKDFLTPFAPWFHISISWIPYFDSFLMELSVSVWLSLFQVHTYLPRTLKSYTFWNKFWIHQMVSRSFCNYEPTNFSRNWLCLFILMYTWAKNVWGVWFLARNHDNHQYFNPSLLLTQETLTDFHGDEAIFF